MPESEPVPPTLLPGRSPDCQAMFHRSGEAETEDKFESFFYSLLIQGLPMGTVEDMVRSSLHVPVTMTNGWAAAYAKDCVARLREG